MAEFHHLLELTMLEQRLLNVRNADEAELVRPVLSCQLDSCDQVLDEDTIALLESNSNPLMRFNSFDVIQHQIIQSNLIN